MNLTLDQIHLIKPSRHLILTLDQILLIDRIKNYFNSVFSKGLPFLASPSEYALYSVTPLYLFPAVEVVRMPVFIPAASSNLQTLNKL